MPAPRQLDSVFESLQRLPLDRLSLRSPVFRKGGYLVVYGECGICGRVANYSVNNLERGKSTGCRCRRRVKYGGNELARVFGERYDAIKQRCENPLNTNFPLYGGRGILNRFEDRETFIHFMLDFVRRFNPQIRTREDLSRFQIDRTENDGHYEPGNLRLVSPQRNITNTRRNRFTLFHGVQVVTSHLWHLLRHETPKYAFSPEWTSKLAKKGLSGEEILHLALHRKIGGKPAMNTPSRPDNQILGMYSRVTGVRCRPKFPRL